MLLSDHHSHLLLALSHSGLYSHTVSGGHLVVPRKVNHFGEHISHDLTHHWTDDDDDGLLSGLANRRRRRARRSVGDPAALHYTLQLNNETLHIELEYSIEQTAAAVAHCSLITGNINSRSISFIFLSLPTSHADLLSPIS